MDNNICGGYVFSSNFDSGNLNKVELVHWNAGILYFKFENIFVVVQC